jgi:hypothetical protein|tara:strand:- start:254 stop:421 length:168 start_codon:yes stop_codon:yes gene_type:complete
MDKKYKIQIAVDNEELEKLLYEGKSFNWRFIPVSRPKEEEGQEIEIEVELFNENA